MSDATPPSLPTVYFNGFSFALANSDVMFTLTLQGKPVMVLHTSYAIAKTMESSVRDGLEKLERGLSTKLHSAQEIEIRIQALQKEMAAEQSKK